MKFKTTKYLRIHDWNYWWGFYHCADGWDTFNGAEFSIFNDKAGEEAFFHFDFYNLDSLEQTIQEGDFMEPTSSDYPNFLKQVERLKTGEQDWFVGALYYPDFSPDLAFCNASYQNGTSLMQLISPPTPPPYYGVIFLREKRPLSPETLTAWVERLSKPLFGVSFSCQLIEVPTSDETNKSYIEAMKPMKL